MRIPPFYRYRQGMQMAGMFILGAVVGALLFNSVYIARMDSLFSINGELESKLDQAERDLKLLNEHKNQHSAIKTIQAYIENGRGKGGSAGAKLDSQVEAALKKRLLADLSVFIGNSIYEIDSESRLARKLLDNKIYTDVLGKDYMIEIRTMLVVEGILKVWVQATVRGLS